MSSLLPVPKVGTLVAAWLVLVITTLVSSASSYINLGFFNFVVVILIAVLNASIIVWILMGVRYTTSLTKLFVVGGFVWLSIMFFITFSDYNTRSWTYQPQAWSNTKAGGASRQ